nr:MAG TPA: hypothetical protein [Caudoviricetes sp.]
MLPLPEPTPTRQVLYTAAGWVFTPNPHPASCSMLSGKSL